MKHQQHPLLLQCPLCCPLMTLGSCAPGPALLRVWSHQGRSCHSTTSGEDWRRGQLTGAQTSLASSTRTGQEVRCVAACCSAAGPVDAAGCNAPSGKDLAAWIFGQQAAGCAVCGGTFTASARDSVCLMSPWAFQQQLVVDAGSVQHSKVLGSHCGCPPPRVSTKLQGHDRSA